MLSPNSGHPHDLILVRNRLNTGDGEAVAAAAGAAAVQFLEVSLITLVLSLSN